jgi:hypothetical protein
VSGTTTVPQYSHIVVVVEENHNYDEIIGNTVQAPFINSLAAGGALLANYTAITHPSQPNYFALYAGSTFGTTDDDAHSEPDPTLATILQAAGRSFIGYLEHPGTDFNHDPWVSFPEGRTVETGFGPATSYPTFGSMFPSGDYSSLPSVSFVIPSNFNDMHNGTIQTADSWLQTNLAAYAQWAVANNSLLVVTWDENDDESGRPVEHSNQIAAILYGAGVVPGTYTAAYNHYNMLSTILGAFGLTGPNNAATAAPIQVFAGQTISGTTTGPVVLSAANNPLVIASGGAISASGAGRDAIDGPAGTPWAIKNNGSVGSANAAGIVLQTGGAVSNASGASIAGGTTGIAIYGSAGSIINAGQITGGASNGILLAGSVTTFVYGVAAGTSNSVTNAAGGVISGHSNGVYIKSAGQVSNSGSIGAALSAGIDLGGGGSVTNNASATVSGGQFGVFISGGSGTVSNGGKITGTSYDGVVLGAGGSVTNNAGGSIAGATGVYVQSKAAGSVTNAGTITGVNSDAVALADGGSVANAAGGMVAGATNGVHVMNASGTVTNAGTITGGASGGYGALLVAGGSISNSGSISGRDGIGLRAGGSLDNQAGAVVAGVGASGVGIFVAGNPGTITNAGRVSGTGFGALMQSGGSLANAAGGSVSGATAGIMTTGTNATVLNSGSIKATSGAGVDIEHGGSVTNNANASIYGSGFGVFDTGAPGTLVNSGSIVGGSNIGVLFAAGGSATNASTGSISGRTAGFSANNLPVVLSNSGVISASAGAAADIEAGGSVTNNAGASLLGNGFGVFVFGAAGTIANAGTITGTLYDGVVLSGGGSVVNTGGAITGGSIGVYARSGAAASVTNSGSIRATASGGAGIDLAGGGTVNNAAGGTISGAAFGVLLNGGTVTNAGTISSGSYAVRGASRLVVNPGAVFVGNVAGNGNATLELASGTGTISGIESNNFNISQFNFQTLAVDVGANWTLNGPNGASATVNNGTIAVNGSLYAGTVDAASTGTFQLDAGATLEIFQIGALPHISFLGSDALTVDWAAGFGTNVGKANYAGPLLQNFDATDTIDLRAFPLAGATLNYDQTTGLLQVTDTAGFAASLSFDKSTLGAGSFHVASDGGSGVFITHS